MVEELARKGVSTVKLRITPNWADGDLIRPLPRATSIRAELGLDRHLVVLYSGNMGYTADLGFVVEAARLLQTERDIAFLLVGDGVRRADTVRQAEGLSNVHFLPIQPRDRFREVLATSDLALVLLSGEGAQVSVPSKIYSIMAAGRPVIAICDPSSEIVRVLKDAACGSHAPPGDAGFLACLVREYRNNPQRLADEGKRARGYFEGRFTADVCIPKYESVMRELLACDDKWVRQ
jgi:colanic acid biosynthesis glycosyl transferase WcaI